MTASRPRSQSPLGAPVWWKRPWVALPALALVALAVRVVYFLELRENPFFQFPIVDSQTYDEMATRVAGGDDAYPSHVFFQPPLYPYFLGLLYKVFGRDIAVARLIQMLVGVVNVLLLYALGRRLLGHWMGVVCGGVAALYGTLLFFEGELLPPVVIVCLNLLLMHALLSYLARPGLSRSAVAGLLLGASALAMVVVLPFALVALVYAAWWHRRAVPRSPARVQLAHAGAFLAGIAIVIAPTTWRNYREGREFVLISANAGINFYIGTGTGFDKKTGIRPGYAWQALLQSAERAGHARKGAQSDYFVRQSLALIQDDPLAYFRGLGTKLYYFVHGDEVLRNQEIYPFRQYSKTLALLVWKQGVAVPFGLLLPLALLGAVLALVRRNHRLDLLLLFVLTHVLVIIQFFVCARYRMNVLPFLVLLAVYGAFGAFEVLRRSSWRPRLLLGLGTAVALVICNFRLTAMSNEFNADAAYNLGTLQFEMGLPDARKWLEEAVRLQPDYPEANGNLGLLLLQRDHDLAGARACFETVLRHYPNDIGAKLNLGSVLAYQGDIEGAKQRFREVLRLDPTNQAALGNLQVLERGPPSGSDG